MDISRVKLFSFSPCGGTAKVLDALAAGFPWPAEKYDLTRPSRQARCGGDELAVFGFPVYAGRAAPIAEGAFSTVVGDKAPAVLVAVYGNRAYERAFLDLDALAKGRGFVPLAAVAGVAEHCIFPSVATGRPDGEDVAALGGFGSRIAEHLAKTDMGFRKVFRAPGADVQPKRLPAEFFIPSVNREICDGCGDCAKACPTGAIPPDDPGVTIWDNCLWCMACVRQCPKKARLLANPAIPQLRRALEERCALRLEPEAFF